MGSSPGGSFAAIPVLPPSPFIKLDIDAITGKQMQRIRCSKRGEGGDALFMFRQEIL